MLKEIKSELHSLADPEHAEISQRFFKTGKGEYGEGDVFIGVRVPKIRALAKKHQKVKLDVVEDFMTSEIHEERMLAIVILMHKFRKGSNAEKEEIYNFYLNHLEHVNNWDLVDVSAMYIIGVFLENRSRDVLYELVHSKNLWFRRVGIMSTFWFIKKNDFDDTLNLAQILLHDEEDLIHKAVGWMLREVGNRNRKTEEAFLQKHYKDMPRTMLRYAIENFPEELRQQYLKGKI